jgi:hypothetical protein
MCMLLVSGPSFNYAGRYFFHQNLGFFLFFPHTKKIQTKFYLCTLKKLA